MRTPARFAGATGAVVLALSLAACGGSSSGTASMPGMNTTPSAAPAATTGASTAADATQNAATHNAADVSFAQNMIVHHQGALVMAKLAATQASSAQVKDLAARIEAAQNPEIAQMTDWLKTWGQPVTAEGSMPGMDTDSAGAIGMMSTTQMNQLKAVTGKGFDQMFLQMMTIHHQGAITMATAEQADGSNPQAIALAKSIETSQSAEVTEMSAMLQGS